MLSSAAVASTSASTSASTAASASRRTRAAKCDRDVKLHVSKALYDDLTLLARLDQRPVSEYVRVLLERHIYGALGVQRP